MKGMNLKEKLKLFLDEELIDQAEYDKLIATAGDEEEAKKEPNEEKKDVETPNGKETQEDVGDDAHKQIEGDKPKETAEEIKQEASTETAEKEANETPQEQASEENSLLKRIDELEKLVKDYEGKLGKIEEVEKTNEALAQRVATVEELLNKLSVKADDDEEDFGASGTGKSTNGGKESAGSDKNIWSALGGVKY